MTQNIKAGALMISLVAIALLFVGGYAFVLFQTSNGSDPLAQVAGVGYLATSQSEDTNGCTDSIAINYNPRSINDDGSCDYGPITYGEYHEIALILSGSIKSDFQKAYSSITETDFTCNNSFNKTVQPNQTHEDVPNIRLFLSTFFNKDLGSSNVFDSELALNIVEFQKIFADEILIPYGSDTVPTSNFGRLTRAAFNKILDCDTTITMPSGQVINFEFNQNSDTNTVNSYRDQTMPANFFGKESKNEASSKDSEVTTTTPEEDYYTTTNETSCRCPYKIITVGGVGSGKDNALNKWVEDNFGGSTASIGDGKNASGEIKNEIEKEKNSEDPQKLLIIAHSVGAAKLFNVLSKGEYGDCVEAIYIDPPVNHAMCKLPGFNFVSPIFNDNAREICKARGGEIIEDPNTISTTNGTAKPPELHDPFTPVDQDQFGNPVRTPAQNEILNEIRNKINEKKNSCESV